MRLTASANGSLNRPFRAAVTAAVLLSVTALTGCGSSMPSLGSLFDEKKAPLPGTRIAVLQDGDSSGSATAVEAREPVVIPPPRANDAWSQPGGAPNNAPGNLALAGSLKTVWRSDAGTGSSKKGRLTAVPIVADGKIFTLDTEGNVSAFSASGGSRLWRTSLKPEKEKAREGFGGGLAMDGGRLYAATGFGTVVALDPSSGKAVWTKSIGIPIRHSPTAANGKVFVVNAESQLFCLNGADGSELWVGRGLPETASMLSNVSPAISGNLIVVPYASGEIAAFDANSGEPKWTDSISRASSAGTAMGAIGEPARPVIEGNAVFAVSRAGNIIATAKDNGDRLWSREISASQTPWVAGDTVFVADTSGKLLALARKDGKIRWVANLPDAKSWSGPVLAGGKLWLASDKGLMVGVDAVSGAVSDKVDIGAPVYITPVVANGKLYVLSDKASLIAMN